MKETEIEGKTVTMAVESGLAALSLRRDQVEVEVLQEPNPGFMGFGAKPARVRLREKIWEPPSAAGPDETRAEPPEAQAGTAPAAAPAAKGRPALGPRRFQKRPAPKAEPVRPPAPPEAGKPPVETPREPGFEPASRPDSPRPPGREGRDRRPPGLRGGRPGGPRTRVPAPRYEPREGPPPPPPDPMRACEEARVIIEEAFKAFPIAGAAVKVEWDPAQERVRADVDCPDPALLIGPGGRTLESLQYLVALSLTRRLQTPAAVQIEAGGYWRDKEEETLRQAHQAMEVVKRTAEPVRLQPMDACMRRLIHRSLANHPEIETFSEGAGPMRAVTLRPRRSR